MVCAFYKRFLVVFLIVLSTIPEGFTQNIFTKIDPGVVIQNVADKIVAESEHYALDSDLLFRTLNQTGTINLNIPVDHQIKALQLQKVNILSPDYKLFTGSGKEFDTAKNYSFYHGSVLDEPNSKVSMVYYNNQLALSIFDKDGNFEVNKEGDFYAGYYNHNRIEPIEKDWACEVIDESNLKSGSEFPESRSSSTPECVTVFLELDHNMYNKKGANIANAEAWAMTIFAQVAILFIEHDVPMVISGIQVWDTVDPYISATNTSGALNLFRNAVHNNPNFNGRLAHLLSGRSLGGGIAYLNSLCSSSTNVAVSANLSGGSVTYPTYSWNVMVITHELGHNMGSPHTQSCSWNGNNTAIDGCGNIEGSCADPGNPPNNVGGTIMSYCHLTSAGINFNNGFGPQPGGLIYERYSNASCETGENCSYVTPFNDVCNRAKELPILNYCVKGYFQNYEVTASGDGGSMSCGNTGAEEDIWYSFDFIDVDSIYLKIEATDIISDLVVEVYSGDCNSLTSIDCGFTQNGDPLTLLFDDPSLINETLYIRIVEDGSDEEGEFSICLYSEELPCQEQLDTLLNIYEDLDGEMWTNKNGWTEGWNSGSCDYCNWYGVQCNYLGEIIEINLENNNLQGSIPIDLTALSNLQRLKLNNNGLTDTIPNYWDSLDQLFLLDLRQNALTGAIPFSYTTMTKINTIHLDNNSLSQEIPIGLGYNSSLRTFTASNNMLEGCFSNGVSSFCYKDSINLSNNPDLPYGGDVTLLCEEGWGTDWDLDGFCNEVEDCDDFDANINPDADEVLCDAKDNNCDGVIDEGSDFGPNIWIGPDTLGIFDDSTNWSLGHIPLICENIEIGLNGDTINLVLLGNDQGGGGTGQGGEGGFGTLSVRNLTIGTNTTLFLGETYGLSILGNGVLVNNGVFNVEGYININDQNNTSNTAFTNNGTFNVINYGGLSIQEIGEFGLHNTSTGSMNMEGYSNIDAYNSDMAKSAILNEGSLMLFGNIYIYGTYVNESIKNSNGGVIEVMNEGYLSVQE
ncbi:MAG: M12 family metallo-peptidase [Saprospiraceae bacterium]|nr:M12 family metallo-peptidase [Saprospiraceae bacterium]